MPLPCSLFNFYFLCLTRLYLFKFFSVLVAKVLPCPGLLTFSQYLPKTFVTARRTRTGFKVYKIFVACPKCNKLYKPNQCVIRNKNGTELSKSCSYVEFPSHPWTSFRAPCKTMLMKGIKSSNGKVFLYPKLSFLLYAFSRLLNNCIASY